MKKPSYDEISAKYKCNRPVKIKKYRAYKNGEHQVFDTLRKAQQFSDLIEVYTECDEQYKQDLKNYKDIKEQIWNEYYQAVVEYFTEMYNLTKPEIELLFHIVGSDGDYDDLLNNMIENVEILKIAKRIYSV